MQDRQDRHARLNKIIDEATKQISEYDSLINYLTSAFLASSHASSELVSAILPSHLNSLPLPFIDEAAAWCFLSMVGLSPMTVNPRLVQELASRNHGMHPRASATAKHLLAGKC